MSDDALALWCRVREQVDWSSVTATPVSVRPAVDGLAAWFNGPVRHSDPDRADRLLAAMTLSRAAASLGEPLTPAMLDDWQKLALGIPDVRLRRGDGAVGGAVLTGRGVLWTELGTDGKPTRTQDSAVHRDAP